MNYDNFNVRTKIFYDRDFDRRNGVIVPNTDRMKFQRDRFVKWDNGMVERVDIGWLQQNVETIEEFRYLMGLSCTVKGYDDIVSKGRDWTFIDKDCVVIQKCKSGLIHVELRADRRRTACFPQRNIVLLVDVP
jgi:hypothetical protein